MWPFKTTIDTSKKYKIVIPEDITTYELAKLLEAKWKHTYGVKQSSDITVGEKYYNERVGDEIKRLFIECKD